MNNKAFSSLLLLLLASCGGHESEPHIDPYALSGKQWQLHYVRQAFHLPATSLNTYTLNFEDENTLLVEGPCGAYGLVYQIISNEQIRITDNLNNLAQCTQAQNTDDLNAQINWITQAHYFQREGDSLILQDSAKQIQVVAEKAFDGCDTPKILSNLEAGELVHVVFAPDEFATNLSHLQRIRPDLEIIDADYCAAEVWLKANQETLNRLNCDKTVMQLQRADAMSQQSHNKPDTTTQEC